MQVSGIETVWGNRAVIRAAEQADRQDANVAVTSIDQGLRGGCYGRIVINTHKRQITIGRRRFFAASRYGSSAATEYTTKPSTTH